MRETIDGIERHCCDICGDLLYTLTPTKDNIILPDRVISAYEIERYKKTYIRNSVNGVVGEYCFKCGIFNNKA